MGILVELDNSKQMIRAHKENSNRRVCHTLKALEAESILCFFFSFPFKLYIFPLLHHGLLWLIVIITGVKVSTAMGWMTYMWWCELAWTSYCFLSLFPQMAALLLCKCGTLNCGFTCKLILVLASTADSVAFQAYTHHMYCVWSFFAPNRFWTLHCELATKNNNPAST